MQHPSGIPEKIVGRVFARRGRLHAFEAIDPKTTALVVIDLDEATVANDDVSQCMTETVNTPAAAVRQGGGVVAWVLSRMNTMPRRFSAILGADLATRHFNDGQAGGAGTRLWHALDRKPDDVVAIKSGASAFFPGKCNLKPQLDARGVDRIPAALSSTDPCRPPMVRATHGVRPAPAPVRKPVIVEHVPVVADDDDVIAGVAGRWPNPFRLETAVRILFEERVHQHVTRAGGEEHAVREHPASETFSVVACMSAV